MKTAWIAGAVAWTLAGSASASPLSEALARHSAADVAALRAQLPGDAAVRCTLGTVYALRDELPRAMVYLDECTDAELPADIAMGVVRATRDVKKRLRASELAQLSIVTDPPGMIVELDALAGEKLTAPTTVWVKAGPHRVRAGTEIQNTITVEAYSRATIYLVATPRKEAVTTDGRVDFTEDNATEQTVAPPPDIKRPSLVQGKYAGDAGPRVGPELEDPLAWRGSSGPRPWFGLRLGAGMYDDGAASSSWRPSVALAARFKLAPRSFLAARVDWSRRGGSADAAVDSIGASVGAGYTALVTRSLAVAVIGQLRGDLRFVDTRNMMAVSRAGAAVAAGLEVAFAATPLTAGLRFEQGLTELVPGARDRALLVEVGVDWR
ncbi:MAG: hypothetical protein H0T42_24415 [Deltaproteobacteria bacterium]|nr:hypothetical protein [Deltaproteobacteria bacterium]